MSKDRAWKQVRAEWREVVLVCRKCAKKIDGGFGADGDETFARALRRSLDEGERRKVKALRREVAVLEVGCLDICPKKAVVVVKGSAPRSLILVPKGAGMVDVMERLGLPVGDSPEGAAAEQRDPDSGGARREACPATGSPDREPTDTARDR